MEPVHSPRSTEFCCSFPQAKNIAFALTIIAALSTLLLGVLAYCNVDPFGGIGTMGTQALIYGGAGLFVLALALKTIDYLYHRIPQKDLDEDILFHQQPLKSVYETFLERRALLSYVPSLPLITMVAPENFSTFDEVKKEYKLPICQYGSKLEIDYFTRTSIPTLLKTILKGMEHPDQLPLVFEYLSTQIAAFNHLISTKNSKAQISEETILSPLRKELESVCNTWRRLLEINQHPSLDPKGLTLLHTCSDELTNPLFYAGYSSIQKQLQNLVLAIVCKPTPDALDGKLVEQTLKNFSTKLGKESLPSLTTLEIDLHSFFTQLVTDVEAPFHLGSEGSAPLTLEDAQRLLEYLDAEPKRVNQTIHQFIQEHQCLGWTPQDNLDDFIIDFSELERLVGTWGSISRLVTVELPIDGKIRLLQLIAKNLPLREAEIWNAYGEIKEGMGRTLLPLTLGGFFLNYKFWLDNDDDLKRRDNINDALREIAHKLGADGSLQFLEIIPDPSDDALIQQALQAEENEKFRKSQQTNQDYLTALALSQQLNGNW